MAADDSYTPPSSVGIIAMEVYVPKRCVSQKDLEAFDGVSEGKYTIGLGQEEQAFVGDREDVISMAMTVTQNLLEKHAVDPTTIGRLEVGTETILDHSKSVKTYLMSLFEASGNSSIEGADTVNACYGGTAALLNAVAWVESGSWDGRLAIVVCSDIAVYAKGPARPTGGAGAVAMLVGPNAVLAVDRGLRGSHAEHVYDFFKPKLDSEYPTVDGRASIQCYLRSLDMCYRRYKDAFAKRKGKAFEFDSARYAVFHAPFNRLVAKAFSRLWFAELREGNVLDTALTPAIEAGRSDSLEDTYTNKDLERELTKATADLYDTRVHPATAIGRRCGNLNTANVYGGLAALLSATEGDLVGERILLYSYGSGSIASLFSLTVTRDVAPLRRALAVAAMLDARQAHPPAAFHEALQLREDTHSSAPYAPTEDVAAVVSPGAYYLVAVDGDGRREYARRA